MVKVMFYWNLPFPLQIVNIELLQFPNKNLFQGKTYMSSKAALMKYWSYKANVRCIQRHFNINFVGVFYCSHYIHDKIITSTVQRFLQRQRESQTTTQGTMPHSSPIVRGFFNVPHKCCKTRPMVYRPYPKRPESLTICRFN